MGVLKPEKLSKPNNSYEAPEIKGANAAAATCEIPSSVAMSSCGCLFVKR